MPLVTTTEMFKKAYDGGYAIGAFNVNNMEIVQGITEACREEKAPVILQVSKGARAYANHTYLVKLVEAAVLECPEIPIALHLDHGPDFETCKACIDGGFTSVMIDASSKPFAENIEITRKVVEYAHDHGVVVEAELGTLAGIEDDVKVAAHAASYTRPEEVEEFVTKTGCDSLAIAIGTSHGAYKFTADQCTRNEKGILVPPPLRFDVLEEVSKRLPGFPIVLHGSSSVPQNYVKMINENGGKMPDAVGIPEEQLRHAAELSGHDRHHPRLLQRASRQVRPPRVPEARPRQHQGTGSPQAGGRPGLRRQGVIPIKQHIRQRCCRMFFCPGLHGVG